MHIMPILIGITLLTAFLIGILVVIIAKPVRQGRVSPAAANFFGLLAALLIMGVFVAIMGVVKNLQG
jgi:hypothetical protein